MSSVDAPEFNFLVYGEYYYWNYTDARGNSVHWNRKINVKIDKIGPLNIKRQYLPFKFEIGAWKILFYKIQAMVVLKIPSGHSFLAYSRHRIKVIPNIMFTKSYESVKLKEHMHIFFSKLVRLTRAIKKFWERSHNFK